MALSNDNELIELLYNNASLLERGTFKLYRRYVINRNRPNEREICEPIKELKELQKRLIPIIKKVRYSNFSYAYEKGFSLKDGAVLHKRANYIFHTDIKSFFPSITKRMFVEVFCKNMPLRTLNLFWNAVSFNDGLAIGAPTSPFICNRIMTECDKRLAKIYRFKKYSFSRYADDLIFSSKKRFKDDFFDKVADIVEDAGFRLNRKKSYFMHARRQVTGILIVDKNRLSVGTGYKKRLKSDIYNYLTKGIGQPDVIRGKFSHLKSIEPDYANRIIEKYKNLGIEKLLKPSRRQAAAMIFTS